MKLIFLLILASFSVHAASDEDREFDKDTLEGVAINEEVPASLAIRARFDAAFSGGEPTQQGFTTPHFYIGVEGVASQFMSYRLSVSPSREYSSTLIPNLVPTEAFFRITNIPQSAIKERPHLGIAFGLFAPAINPLWTPDIGELWIPDFFVAQRLIFLTRDIGVEFSGSPVPGRLEFAAGYFNGNGVFGFNTNNSRAVNGYVKTEHPLGNISLFAGAGGFQFTQGSSGTTNYRSQLLINPFVGVAYDPWSFLLTVEGWWGTFEDSSLKRKPKGVVGSLRIGHPRLQVFARYLNLSSAPALGGYLSELHTGFITHPFPYLKMFLYYQQVKGRSAGTENSVNLRARFSL